MGIFRVDLPYLEFVAEWLVVEENPWVLVLAVPLELELAHALH
jgi:hypothetical protein